MTIPRPAHPFSSDLGVSGLRGFPEHWEVRRLRTVLRSVTERNQPELPLLSVVREQGVILRNVSDKSQNHNFVPDDLSNYKVVRRGQFAINKMKAWQGSYGVSRYDGIVSPAYHIYSIAGVDDGFFHAAIRSRAYVPYFTAASDGVRVGQWDLSATSMREIPFLVPSRSEQARIVRFLDRADWRIRRYIRAKQRLIELLEEKKQAIIHQAVTGRIDIRTGRSYPAYKDSGVEWLGKVPQHWAVVRLGRITLDRCDGPFGSGLKSSHYTDEGVRVVRLQNIGRGEFLASDAAFISPEHYSTLGDHSVEGDDVLIAGLGDANHPAGRACVAPQGIGLAMVKADCFRFRLDQSKALPQFIALQLTATAHAVSGLLSTGATRQRVNLHSTAARAVTIPGIREQSRIVEYTMREISSHVDAQSAAARGVDLLGEYRTRLIADIVTGKLDVREAAVRLLDADPVADGSQGDTINTESNPRALDCDIAKRVGA